MAQKVLDALKATHAGAVDRTASPHGDETAWIKRDSLLAVATWLKNDPAMLFDAPVFCTAIAYSRTSPGRTAPPLRSATCLTTLSAARAGVAEWGRLPR